MAAAAEPVVVQLLAATEPGGRWSQVSLELAGDARALADRLRGRVGAWVLARQGDLACDPAMLCRHGVDAVWRLADDRLAAWCSEAIAAATSQHVPPSCRVILLAGDAPGEEAAALLAERLETEWIHSALSLSTTRSGAIEVTTVSDSGRLTRTLRARGDRPVVVTMAPGVAEPRERQAAAELEVHETRVDLSSVPALTRVEAFVPADPRTIDLVDARRIVAAGRGAGGPEGVELVRALADALGAALGASRMAVDLGWAPQDRQIGQTGRTVRPELYVACGISGASHHLAGIRESRTIVAINPDRAAPIHQVSHLSLEGDLHQVIPAALAALERRRAGGAAAPTP